MKTNRNNVALVSHINSNKMGYARYTNTGFEVLFTNEETAACTYNKVIELISNNGGSSKLRLQGGRSECNKGMKYAKVIVNEIR